jgi:hypothetical protein
MVLLPIWGLDWAAQQAAVDYNNTPRPQSWWHDQDILGKDDGREWQ